jgi:hypothetical protein
VIAVMNKNRMDDTHGQFAWCEPFWMMKLMDVWMIEWMRLVERGWRETEQKWGRRDIYVREAAEMMNQQGRGATASPECLLGVGIG